MLMLLFLFVRPTVQDLMAVRHILDLFGEASGLHENFKKSTATLIRGEVEEEQMLQMALGCALAKFPIRYLGILLGLRPLTKAEWQPMIDRVLLCLQTCFIMYSLRSIM